LFVTLGLSLSLTTAVGWSFRGHVLISQIAYDNLTTQSKTEVDKYTKIIASQLSKRQNYYFAKTYPHASEFARLSTLPDTWREKTVAEIYARFHAPLPKVLTAEKNAQTSDWHFIEQGFPNSKCKLGNKHDVVWAIKTMQKAIQESDNPNSKAVSMVFLAHFVGDIHQPLHTITHAGEKCRSDYGGNNYYVNMGKRNSINLHKLWDIGIGYLNKSFNTANKAKRLQKEFPKNKFKARLAVKSVSEWAKENYEYANFIYTLPQHHQIPPAYYIDGQRIVRFQITLAGYRLAILLNTLF